jgi:hypothetical protein
MTTTTTILWRPFPRPPVAAALPGTSRGAPPGPVRRPPRRFRDRRTWERGGRTAVWGRATPTTPGTGVTTTRAPIWLATSSSLTKGLPGGFRDWECLHRRCWTRPQNCHRLAFHHRWEAGCKSWCPLRGGFAGASSVKSSSASASAVCGLSISRRFTRGVDVSICRSGTAKEKARIVVPIFDLWMDGPCRHKPCPPSPRLSPRVKPKGGKISAKRKIFRLQQPERDRFENRRWSGESWRGGDACP